MAHLHSTENRDSWRAIIYELTLTTFRQIGLYDKVVLQINYFDKEDRESRQPAKYPKYRRWKSDKSCKLKVILMNLTTLLDRWIRFEEVLRNFRSHYVQLESGYCGGSPQ